MSWRLEIQSPEADPAIHENAQLSMGSYGDYVGFGMPHPHLVARESSDGELIRVLGVPGGLQPTFNETGFVVEGTGAQLKKMRNTKLQRDQLVTCDRVHGEAWSLEVVGVLPQPELMKKLKAWHEAQVTELKAQAKERAYLVDDQGEWTEDAWKLPNFTDILIEAAEIEGRRKTLDSFVLELPLMFPPTEQQ